MVAKRSPKAWIAVAVALSLAILGVGLGVWQLGRADDKRSMVNARLERQLALAPCLGGAGRCPCLNTASTS